MIRPIAYALAASVAINTLTMVSLDRAFLYEGRRFELIQNQKLLQTQANNFPVEFIEAPAISSPKPATAKKMSNRDSVSRDNSQAKAEPGSAPQIKNIGPSDQLAQSQAKPGQAPRPASPAQPEVKKMSMTPPAPEAPPKEAKPALEVEKEVIQQLPLPNPQSAPSTTPNAKPQPKKTQQEAQSGQNTPSSQDRINTQAMARVKSRGASLSGVTSYDAMGSDMGVYMKNLKEKIWLAWFPYLSFQYPNDFQAADALISITLDAKGEVKSVNVLESYGSSLFTTFCTEAVQRASGFGEIPKEILALLGKDQLEIKFAFHYR